MRELDASTFDAAIAEGTVVVDFWAPWCKPCHAIEPILDDLARSASAVAFVKLNIDEHPEIAARYEVLSIPTVTLFDDGEARTTVVGARPRAHFERAFSEWL
jgi:thioredoxin 1